jgi:L,D-peptidoglycan transpeptidase YkuD (ErfK/YbiS/YcfS/YnhG family)
MPISLFPAYLVLYVMLHNTYHMFKEKGMNRRTVIAIVAIIIVGSVSIFVTRSINRYIPANPLIGHDQIIFVVSRTETANTAKLALYERDGTVWRFVQTAPAVVGENGMAWGRGLHDDRDRNGEDLKKEGDRRSPKGVFELFDSYGYRPAQLVNIRFPYTQITPDMTCIDDARSEYYNRIATSSDAGLDSLNMPSHEDMLRGDDLYKYLIMVGHNTTGTKRGAGSCIFIHIWKDERTPTAGCTAVAEPVMLQILGWLDPAKKPVFVQLTRRSYRRLKEAWGLPDITI